MNELDKIMNIYRGLDFQQKEQVLERIYQEDSGVGDFNFIKAFQINRYIDLDFHQAAGMKCRYFSEILPDPDPSRNLSKALLVVSSELLSLEKQLGLLGAEIYLDLEKYQKPFSKSYWIYDLEDGRGVLGKSALDALKRFSQSKRRGLTLEEGVSLIIQRPNTVKHHFLELSHSIYNGYVPFISFFEEKYIIGARSISCTLACFGSPSCSLIEPKTV